MKKIIKRISKSSLSVVLAIMMIMSTMLVGTITANAAISQWVLRGSFNNWSESNTFGGSTGGSITYDLSSYKGQTVQFRTDCYEDTGNLVMNSANKTVADGSEYELTWNVGNVMYYTVPSDSTGQVVFNVVSRSGKNYITVTAEMPSVDYQYTLYDSDGSVGTFTKQSDTVYTMTKTLAANTTYSYYMQDKESKFYCSNGQTITSSSNNPLTVYLYGSPVTSHRFKLTTENAGDYVFTWTYTHGSNDGQLDVAYPTAVTKYSNITAKAQSTTDGVNFTDDTTPVVTINGGTTAVDDITSSTGVEVVAPVYEGYTFTGWRSDNGTFTSSTSASTTFKPTADNAVAVASYNKNYTITCNTSANGTITVDNSSLATKYAGQSYTINVSANSGYQLSSLLRDTNDVTSSVSSNKYTSVISSDLTFTASFARALTEVTSTDLQSVLNNSKIMFYLGIDKDWDPSALYIGTSQVSNPSVANVNETDYYYTSKTAAAGTTYQVGNKADWGVNHTANNAGAFYYTDSTSGTASSSGGLSTTFADNAIATTGELGASGIGNAYSQVYYIKSNNKYYSLGTTVDEVNEYLASLSEGTTLTLYTCRTDGTITVLDDTDSITIEALVSEYNVSAVAKSTTDGSSYSDFADQTIITIGSTVINRGESTSVATTDVDGYVFAGWTSTKGTFAEATALETTFTPTADGAVAVAQYKKVYTISSMAGANGSITIDEPTGSSITAGESYTVTVAPNDGYAVDKFTVNGTAETLTDNKYTGTATSYITIVASFVEYSGEEVTDGHTFLFSSSNKPTDFKTTSDYKLYLKDGLYTITIPVSELNIDLTNTAEMNFALSTSSSYKDIVNKIYNGSGTTSNVSSTDAAKVSAANSNYNINIDGDNNATQFSFGYLKVLDDQVTAIKITMTEAGKYTVTPVVDTSIVVKNKVNITAKDGTIRSGYQNLANHADTQILNGTTSIGSSSYGDFAETATKVEEGTTVTIKTTIDSSYRTKYYVKGFCINGETYGVINASAADTANGVYTLNYPVKNDTEKNLEITPIYFLIDDSDCVTFYVEGYESVRSKWGNTIACYAYYTGTSDLDGYPGQPMVYENGRMYTQIPKTGVKGITLNNYVWDSVHTGRVSGGTGNNCQTYDYDDFATLAGKIKSGESIVYRFKYGTYNNSNAGAGNVPSTSNLSNCTVGNGYETFTDYYDNVIDLFGNLITNTVEDDVTNDNAGLIIVSDGYVNYYREASQYLGEYATKWYIYNREDGSYVTALPSSVLVYGLNKTSTEIADLISNGSVPSDFLSGTNANDSVKANYWNAYKTLYNNYWGQTARITFESAIQSGGRDGATNNPGYRSDGRWYYSKDGAQVKANILIEYGDTLDNFKTNTQLTDTFTGNPAITGTVTGAQAQFADSNYNGKGQITETGTASSTDNFYYLTTSTGTNGYTFVGWYLLTDGVYTPINASSDLYNTQGKTSMTSNATFVARYIRTPNGSINIAHNLYEGSTGTGTTTVKVEVIRNSDNETVKTYEATPNTVVIDKDLVAQYALEPDNYTIKITLYTVTSGFNKFNQYWHSETTQPDITQFNGYASKAESTEGLETTTVSVVNYDFSTLNTIYSSQLINGSVDLNYYSQIDYTSAKVPFKIQFQYTDRYGVAKYYNVAGYLTDDYINNHILTPNGGTEITIQLTEDFVKSYAPYEDNFFKTITWSDFDITNAVYDIATGTVTTQAKAIVTSTQEAGTVVVNYKLNDNANIGFVPTKPSPYASDFYSEYTDTTAVGTVDSTYRQITSDYFYIADDNGTYFINSDGYFEKAANSSDITGTKYKRMKYNIVADATNGSNEFSYWEIYSSADCSKESYVARCYTRGFSFLAYDNYWIVPVYTEVGAINPAGDGTLVNGTTLKFLEYSRNQWTTTEQGTIDSIDVDTALTDPNYQVTTSKDRDYIDFALSYAYNGKQLNVFDPNSESVQVGLVIEVVGKLESDGNGYNTDMTYYANKYAEDTSRIESQVLNGSVTDGGNKLIQKQIENSSLDNKNRLQYGIGYNNSEANRTYVLRVYSYITYTDSEGNQVVELSNPEYVNLYTVGTATV